MGIDTGLDWESTQTCADLDTCNLRICEDRYFTTPKLTEP